MTDVPSWAADLKPAGKPECSTPRPVKATCREDWLKHEPPQVREYAEIGARLVSYPRSTISCELNLLQPDLWMRGLWGEVEGGWYNARNNSVFTFDDARKLIEDRIRELGL